MMECHYLVMFRKKVCVVLNFKRLKSRVELVIFHLMILKVLL